MTNEFKIPSKICLEAKQFMKLLLKELESNMIPVNGLDSLALELLAYTYHTYTEARKMVMDEGYVLKETNARNTSISKPHPAVKIMYDANAQLTKLVQQFGLTPRSRGNLNNLQGRLNLNPGLNKFMEAV